MFIVHVMTRKNDHREWFRTKIDACRYARMMQREENVVCVEVHNELTGGRVYV